jgi:hypothetical protein
MRLRILLTAIVLAFLFSAQARAASEAPAAEGLGALQFLLGAWEGEHSGKPGGGSGEFVFEAALDGKVLIRRSQTSFPATPQRPAFRHDDLLIVFVDPAGGKLRASYFDNESHVIQYTVSVAADGRAATFLSDAAPNAPRFRLTYVAKNADEVAVKFEIAPPGKPEAFATYLEGSAKRRAPR